MTKISFHQAISTFSNSAQVCV